MEFLLNEELKYMSKVDLEQRYAECYAVYGGHPRYIHTFYISDDDRIHIVHAEIYTGYKSVVQVDEVFQWELLNVARPPAGWYLGMLDDEPTAFLVAYVMKKQYRRGLHLNNTSIIAPFKDPNSAGWYFKTMLSYVPKPERVSEQTMKSNPRMFSPRRDRLVYSDGCVWNMYLHDTIIAKWNDEEMFILKNFRQEVEEVSNRLWLDTLRIQERSVITGFALDQRLRKAIPPEMEERNAENKLNEHLKRLAKDFEMAEHRLGEQLNENPLAPLMDDDPPEEEDEPEHDDDREGEF